MAILDNIPTWLFVVAAAGVVFFPQAKSMLTGLLTNATKEMPQPGIKSSLDSLFSHVAVHCEKEDRTACLDALDILRERLTQ